MSSASRSKSPFDPPSTLDLLLTQPITTLIRLLDYTFSALQSSPKPDSPGIRVVCISDTHTLKASYIPPGDLLIHAGDLGNEGTPAELQAQIDWLDSLPHEHKIVIAGNHDTFLDPRSRPTLSPTDQKGSLDWKSLRYLQHSSTTLHFHNKHRQLKIYGAPQIPACGGANFAFQYAREDDAWSETVPTDTDVLVTHTPPKYHLDLPAALGCKYLLREVWRVKPLLHVFGHVHAGKTGLRGGRETVWWGRGQAVMERALTRSDGVVRAVLDLRCWVDVAKVVWFGVGDVLWDRVWGGYCERTVMVNAALMFNNSGELGNEPQVVDI
ncbi:hypothetical protein LTR62_002153 [Meristemomyces frigidus]|uniref:Calcineurin-like phosphoesterase domain-containing protein n=1 Tax=Meristemomyces frigidus TaxID=1508187 RepID=A0AAN7T8I9_9PEZI|nr:hypothetical protein LTR62_002153 [Meristemomyces frigidus]